LKASARIFSHSLRNSANGLAEAISACLSSFLGHPVLRGVVIF
jgi:hypothetical protein